MKRVVTIQDISCVGKCSLTVALPIISAMGIETAVVPTAVLSTHTAFQNFTFCDLTDQIQPIADHWVAEKIDFDGIYTGYLGSFRQLQLVSDFFDRFRTTGNLILVDPAMGDYGKLYTGFTPEFALEMGKLCGKADIIVPNMTEAAFMLGIPYVDQGYDEAYVQDVLRKLCGLGTRIAVLTGVNYVPGKLGVMSYDSEKDQFESYFNEKIDVNYHGTGDIFASAFFGALMNGVTLAKSMEIAAEYTVAAIRSTEEDPNGHWYGVNFEAVVPQLLQMLGEAR